MTQRYTPSASGGEGVAVRLLDVHDSAIITQAAPVPSSTGKQVFDTAVGAATGSRFCKIIARLQ